MGSAQTISNEETSFIQQEQNQKASIINSHNINSLPQAPADGMALGDDCTNPYLIVIPSSLPFSQNNNTTCGHLNVYSGVPGLGSWTNGEDFIYKLIVNQKTLVDLTMTPHHVWSCMALFDDCPDVGNLLSYVSYTQHYNLDPMTITYQLEVGEYYVMMDTWPLPDCFNFDFHITELILNPVDTIPYYENFEVGSMPQTMLPVHGSEADVVVNEDAAYVSDFGLMFEGGNSDGWGNTPNTVGQAFDISKYTHHAKVNINVIPTGASGTLKMRFRLRQNYSFNSNYSWLRVQVNDNTITDENGYSFYKPNTHYDPFVAHTFDLSAYQGGEFTISIQSSCKYSNNVYQNILGDVAYLDNLEIWYEATPGDLEGYTFDGAGLTVAGATVGIEGVTATQSNADGYYLLQNVPNGMKTVSVWKSGYNLMHHLVHVQPGVVTQKNFILPRPEIIVTPNFLQTTVNPNERERLITGIQNSGDGAVDWFAEISALPTDHQIVEQSKRKRTFKDQDLSPDYRKITSSNPNRNTWDVQFSFPISIGAGCETDGTYLYSTQWNGNEIYKYEISGAYVSTIIIPGVSGIRDLAFCKYTEHFYGSDVSNSLYEMDFEAAYLVGVLTLPSDCRAIAFDDDNDAFYYNNWSTDITMVDRVSGNFLSSFPIGTFSNFYGLAYDNWSDGGPYLWGFSQDGSGGELVQMQLPSGSQTGFVLDVKALLGSSGNAGGLFTHTNLIPGYVTIGGALQNTTLFGLELGEGNPVADWLTLGSYSGTVNPGGGIENIDVYFDANGKNSGDVFLADIVISTSPDIGNYTIACLMNVLGVPLSPPENLAGTLEDPFSGEVKLTWEWSPLEGFQYFVVKRDGVLVGSTTNKFFTDFLPSKNTYHYTVQAVYDEGSTSPAGPEQVVWPDAEMNITSVLPLEQWMLPETVSGIELTISNTGTGTLFVEFPMYTTLDLLNDPEIEKNKTGAPFEYVELEKGQEDPNAGKGFDVILGAGGPDDFGYIWMDDIGFAWTEISQSGAELLGIEDENNIGPFPIGFDFPFYGEIKTEFWINSNGTIGFTPDVAPPNNTLIPTGNAALTDFIAWFWDDMDPGNPNTHIYYQVFDTSYTIIQFQNYYEYPNGGHWLDAQVKIERSGRIFISYLYINPGLELDSETIGIQSYDEDMGLQVAYNTPYIENMKTVLFDLPSEFVVDIEPAFLVVPEGGQHSVEVTYSAEGYTNGNYIEYIDGKSNDEDNLNFIIPNWMRVYDPGYYNGTVTVSATDAPLAGVTVTASNFGNSFQTQTSFDGSFSLQVIEGNYDLSFEKLGYQSYYINDTAVGPGQIAIVDVTLIEESYPPSWVTATVINNETECLVEWALPADPYEILYDDGQYEELVVWAFPGNENAVRFTPSGYPANIQGGRINVGNGTFPNGNWLNTKFAILVYDDNGGGGLPGDMLDSMEVSVDNYGWIEFWGLEAEIDSGDFYLSMMQLTIAPVTAPIAVDFTSPVAYRSYSRMNQGEWSLSPYQDFMIRAYVNGPVTDNTTDAQKWMVPPKLPEGAREKIFMSLHGLNPPSNPGYRRASEIKILQQDNIANRDILFYDVIRLSDFPPEIGPQIGNSALIGKGITELSFVDQDYINLDDGWYAYGVRAQYSSGDVSQWEYSNIIGKKMDVKVKFNISLSDGDVPENVEVKLTGEEWPFEEHYSISDTTGHVVFDSVIKGNYIQDLFKIGYEEYILTDDIQDSTTYDVVLLENRFKPRNFYVNPLTSKAYWEWPLVEVLNEDFEKQQWPPEGWQAVSKGLGWMRTNNGSGPNWTIPPWNSFYACSNDDAAAGSSNNGCCDYLVTPAVDLRQADEFFVRFDSYFDAAYNQSAIIEYSIDAGLSWEVIAEIEPHPGSWKKEEISLLDISGMNAPVPVWIAFHSNDNGEWGSGWAVDNIEISNGFAEPLDFYLFLDGAFVAAADTVNYLYKNLIYGHNYEAAVAARYSSGLSEKLYYSFTSEYLIPPRNLNGNSFDNAVHIWWEAPLEPATLDLISESPRTEQAHPHTDYSPVIRKIDIAGNPNRDQWDIQFTYPLSGGMGEAGIESDENYIYSTKWDGNAFYKYSLDGTYIGEFSIAGVDSIRDLAYNPNTGYMYGGKATTSCFVMDFNSLVLVNQFTAPTEIRAIAYDDDRDAYWANNWNNDITLFDASGYYISSFPIATYGSYYGFAFDNWSDGGPYLWGFSQDGSGGILVQLDLATGNEMFALDVIAMLGASEVAGGLFTQCELIYENKVTISGMIQNEMMFGLELGDCSSGVPGTVPENLLGYNVYRDMEMIGYVPYTGIDTSHFYDYGLEPFQYQYDVTALYDLEPYGFPGDTGESAYEGPKYIQVMYGYPLPFNEPWNAGNFDLNQWVNEINWVIDGQSGQPEPSAKFRYGPIIYNYKSALRSYPLDGMNVGDPWSDGQIYIDFDVRLEDNSQSGTERLALEVGNDKGWFRVMEFDNSKGTFNWEPHHRNISNWAFGNIFRIRFVAEGENSANIIAWYIDNINVYRICPGARNLEAIQQNCVEVILKWSSPYIAGTGSSEKWLKWDNGEMEGGLGLSGGGEFTVASRWDPQMLSTYNGTSISKIRFVPYTDALNSVFNIKIWKGENAQNLIFQEEVSTYTAGNWNEVIIDPPIELDVSQELWFGYTVDGPENENPAAYDSGPSIVGFGDMIKINGDWHTLSSYGPQYEKNWMLRALLTYDNSTDNPITPSPHYSITSPSPRHAVTEPALSEVEGSRALQGYNIYVNTNYLDFTTDTSYLHTVAQNGTYKYEIEAVFEDCVADTLSMPASVDIGCVGSDELSDAAGFSIYPNPANERINIKANDKIQKIQILNNLGEQLYHTHSIKENEKQIDVSFLANGLYLIKITTKTDTYSEKLMIVR